MGGFSAEKERCEPLNLGIHPDFWPYLDHWSQAISVEVLPLNCSDSMLTDKPPVQSRYAIVIITIIAVMFILTFCNPEAEDIVKMVIGPGCSCW